MPEGSLVAVYCGKSCCDDSQKHQKRVAASCPAGELLPEGSLVAEYCGELVPVKECAAHEASYQEARIFYIFCEECDHALPPELVVSMQVRARTCTVLCYFCEWQALLHTLQSGRSRTAARDSSEHAGEGG
jgi:hypothetical protein